MKNLIQERLNMISDLNERRMLRSVLQDVYENVIEYNMDMYDRLEDRIYNEITDPKENYYVYTSINTVNNVDPIDDFLHPMIPSDLESTVYDMKEINERLQSGEPVVITSVFMKCSAAMIKKLLERERAYKGYVKTDKEVYEVDVRVKPCDKYVKEIENLYRAFQNNSIEWGTINCPYAYKFVDIVLDTPLSLEQDEKIKEISVDLAEYEKFKVPNAIPLWNITQFKARDAEFPTPMPVIDRIVYEHKIALEDHGVQNGYLAALDNKDYIYSRRKPEELIIVSTDNNQASWEILKVESISNAGKKGYAFELLSNRRDMGFAGKFSSVKSLVIRTRGEIARLLQSYDEMSKQLLFTEVEILEEYNKPFDTFDFNTFIDDNIRTDPHKKIMLITFSAQSPDDYLLQDKMSFLVSEIQILFPEYKCIGELV